MSSSLPRAGHHDLQDSLIRAIHAASPDGILVVNEHQIVVSHNQRFIEIWRIPSQHLGGSVPGTAIGAEEAPILATALERVKDASGFLARVRELYDDPNLIDHCEIELLDGRTLERHSSALWGSDARYLGRVWFFRDISSQKQTEVALRELSRRDPLTGVANRRYFFERASQEFARATRSTSALSIALVDIDHFKHINDRHGHAAGDEMLKFLCRSSQHLLREMDIFARIGGEEFAVLLPDTGLEGATDLATRLRQTIAGSELSLNGVQINCTISIGVATLRLTDTCPEDSLSRADSAMYRAKRNGRNNVEIET